MKITTRRHLARIPLLAVLLGACTVVGPDYHPPELDLPDAWQQAATAGVAEGTANLDTWWSVFEDPILDELMARARQGNLDLRFAAARVREARALRGVVAADRVPTVDAVGSLGADDPSESRQPGVGSDLTSQIGVDAFWELDVWGRVKRRVESADASIEASVEEWRDVLVLLYSEVGLNYIEARALQARIRFAEANVAAQEETLRLTQDRFRAQLAPQLDVRQAELNLARSEALLPALREAKMRSIHRLAVLLGEHPDALYELMTRNVRTASGFELPERPTTTRIGFPAELLRQRPDIRRAERELAAQTASIGATTAELYPQFSLAGLFAFESRAGGLLDGDNLGWSISLPVRWNLFDRGRIHSRVSAQEARTEQALASYEQTVLVALEDVENALVGYGEEHQRRQALERSVAAAKESVDLVNTLYKTGLTDFQNVLDMERSLFDQQDQLAESMGRELQDLILLYRSLGGGWDPNAPVDPSAPAGPNAAGDPTAPLPPEEAPTGP